MKTVVCVKQVRTLGDEVEFTGDERDVDPDYVELAVNEWDTYAVEEALRVKEATGEGEVVVVTVGGDEAEEALRRCLAMGADRAIRVESEGAGVEDPLTTARRLAAAVAPESPDLVFTGVQSSDSVQAATGTMLAALLDLPQVAVVTKLEYDHGAKRATVHRELEGGLIDIVEVDTPAVADDPDRDQRTALRHPSCHQAGQSTGDRRPGRCRRRRARLPGAPHVRAPSGRGCRTARRYPGGGRSPHR